MGRKNVSPQNLYEISQLYAIGALKIACVGLQCVGFNATLNRTIMEQASKCQSNGRWRSGWTGAATPSASSGDSTPVETNISFAGHHLHLQRQMAEFDASAPAAAAAASAAASVLDESTETRSFSMFSSMRLMATQELDQTENVLGA